MRILLEGTHLPPGDCHGSNIPAFLKGGLVVLQRADLIYMDINPLEPKGNQLF
jgi:hypothetical protein